MSEQLDVYSPSHAARGRLRGVRVFHSGMLAAGMRSGSAIALTGTELGCAWLLAEGKPADRAAIGVVAEAEEGAIPHRPGALSEQRVGKGRIVRALIVSV